MQKSIVDTVMKKVHLCFDKQLYDVTIQVCRNQPRMFQNIVVHPAHMYITVIFACIGTLMKCLALEFYGIAVYGEIRSIYNGKSWMKTMRLFQSVAAALLQRFLSIRQKAFDGIEQYSKQLISNCSTLGGQFSPANTSDSRV